MLLPFGGCSIQDGIFLESVGASDYRQLLHPVGQAGMGGWRPGATEAAVCRPVQAETLVFFSSLDLLIKNSCELRSCVDVPGARADLTVFSSVQVAISSPHGTGSSR
jgi:hypothetical protein